MSVFRPGGLTLTERALALCRLPAGAAVLDVGCGDGDTVKYLRETKKLDAWGVDSEVPDNSDPHLKRAAAESLPFDDGSFDALFCECVFSLVRGPREALLEFGRVLKSGGSLVMSDMYAQKRGCTFAGEVRRLYTKTELENLLSQNGFEISLFEDHQDEMLTLAGQLIMDGGAEAFYRSMGGDRAAFKEAACSYYLLTAAKGAAK